MNKKIKSIYRGSYLVLYAVAGVIWENFLSYLSFFTSFNASYTTGTAKDALAALDAARLLPDASVRRAVAKKLRKQLRTAGKKCCNNFQVFLAYIEKAFSPDEVAAMKQAAGSDSYTKAAAGNLAALIALNTATATFLKINMDALVAGGMPAGFADTLNTSMAEFNKLNSGYTAAIQAEREETNAKTTANNAVYATLVSMLRDAKVIFINDAATRAFFIYDAVAMRFKKEGKTGYRFKITAAGSKAPLEGATVICQPGNIIAAADKTGAAVAELKKDIIYSYTVTLPGYTTVTGNGLQAEPGVMKRKDITLTAAATLATA